MFRSRASRRGGFQCARSLRWLSSWFSPLRAAVVAPLLVRRLMLEPRRLSLVQHAPTNAAATAPATTGPPTSEPSSSTPDPAQSSREQIQAVTKTVVEGLIDEDYVKACSVSTDRGKCPGDIALAASFVLGKNGTWKSLYGDQWEAQMMAARVTVTGSKATMAAWGSDNEATHYRLIGDRWLAVV